jgi:hypothetical protein
MVSRGHLPPCHPDVTEIRGMYTFPDSFVCLGIMGEMGSPGRATSFALLCSPLCLPWEFFCGAKATDDGERDTKFQVSPCTLAPLLTSCSKMILSMSPKNYIFHTDLPAIGIPNINPNIVTLPQAPTPFRDCAHLVASWTHPSQLVYEFAGT